MLRTCPESGKCSVCFERVKIHVFDSGTERARKLHDDVISRTWEEVQAIKDQLANLFPGGFVEIVNNRAGEDVFRKAFVEIGKLIKKPPNKPAAKMWIAHELEQKKR